jgi:outer membrane receptor protein involved in Fe transport
MVIFKRTGFILIVSCGFVAYGQDTTRLLKPVPVFSQAQQNLRLSNLSSTVPHFEFSSQKINELGGLDVGDAVKFIPGIQLRDYGGIGGLKTVSFRSLGAGHTGILVDGSSIPNVQSGVANLSSFELFGLEKIQFSAGQIVGQDFSASAFAQASAISLQSILFTPPTKFKLGIYSNTTSINSYEEGIYLQTKLGKHFFTGVQAMTRFGSGEYGYIHPQAQENGSLNRNNTAMINYRLRWLTGYIKKQLKLTLSAFYNNNQQELPGAVVLYNPSNDQKLWNEDVRINLNHRSDKGKWQLLTHADFQSNFTRYYDPFALNLQGFVDVTYQQTSSGLGAMVYRQFRFPSERIFFGSDALHTTLQGNEMVIAPLRIQQVHVVGGSTVFGKFKVESNLTAQVANDFSNESQTNQFFKLSPFLAVAYLPIQKVNLRVRGFYKNTYRLPTFNDLYYNFIGNTQLKPEDAQLFNLGITYGIEHKKNGIEFTADAYQNSVINKIVAIPTKDLFNWSMQNIGKTDIKGLDLGMFIFFNVKKIEVQLNSNHSFNQSLDVTDTASITYRHQIPYTPFYSSSNGVSLHWKKVNLNANAIYSGFRYSLNENTYTNLLPAFTDINVGLAYTFKFLSSELLVDVKAMNVLNKNYEVIRSFPMPGRYYQFRLKYAI